jgi:hypothetical protein
MRLDRAMHNVDCKALASTYVALILTFFNGFLIFVFKYLKI